MPNIVQTLEHNPILVHGGPFANIAHGCSSIISTKMALKMADYIVTEAGFGSDLGAEKFFNIKSRQFDLKPDVAVIVATIRALKYHGGFKQSKAKRESSNNQQYIERGFENLVTHIENMKKFNVPVIVAINRFKLDTNMDLRYVKNKCAEIGIDAIVSEHHYRGGEGATELAKKIVDATKGQTNDKFQYLYSSQMNLYDKINTIATEIYRADNIVFSNIALRKLKQLLDTEYNLYPVCIAKTQYSFSDNPKDRGLLVEHTINVKDIRLAAGAKFVVVYLGNVMTMPGLPRVPAAENIGVDEDYNIHGLF
jgi:formate--tetrahydrofolate ligase